MSEMDPIPSESIAGGAPGKRLAALRVERGMSLEEVARHLKFSARQIEALEFDDYAALPGSTIVRGMVRSYSRLLKIDPEPLLADVRARLTPVPHSDTPLNMSVPFPASSGTGRPYYWMIGGVLLLLGLFVGAERLSGGSGASPANAPSTSTSTPVLSGVPPTTELGRPIAGSANAPEPAAAAGGASAGAPTIAPATPSALELPVAALPPGVKRIVLKFERDSWVEVKGAGGRVLMNQVNPAGSEKTIEGNAPFNLVIGAAGGVRLSYNNEPVELAPHIRVDVARLTLN